MALLIEIKAADGLASRTRLEAGNNRFTVRLGDSYRILDEQTGLPPPGITVKRVDNNLIVDGLGNADGANSEPVTVEFAEFYSVCSAGSPCELIVDQGPGGTPVAITPGSQPIGALADGSFVLYDADFAETAPAAPSLGDDATLRYALYGLGGAAVLGLAAGGGGGGGGGGDSGGATPDGSLRLTSSTFTNSHTPTITGQGEPGAKVTVRIDTDGDGVPNVTYSTTVAADFVWSVDLATATPESGALPPGGLPEASNVGVTSTTAGGNTSLPTFVLAYDGTPPAPAVINTVAGDNVVNAAEKDGGVVVSGRAEAGATVTLSWGQQVRTAVADGAGNWQTPAFDPASIPANGDYGMTAVVQDRAGNNSGTTTLNVSVNTTPPILNVRQVGGDGKINASEAANVAFQGTTDPNGAVTIVWNGFSKTDTADGSGNWNATFAGAEVPNTAGGDIPFAITATNVVGNVSNATGSVFVDRAPPAAPTIAPVAGNNLINNAEGAGGVSVTGSGEAGSTIILSWGGRTASAVVDSAGNWQTGFAPSNLPANGTYTMSAVARDDAGNETAGASRPVLLELGPAPLAMTAIAGNNIVTANEIGNVAFVGTAAANAAINVVWNNVIKPTAANGSGNWSVSFSGAEVPVLDGVQSDYYFNTTSPAGNINQILGSVLVDTVAPAVPAVVTSQVVGNVFSASGSGTAGSTITVQVDPTPLTPNDPLTPLAATVALDGTWSVSGAVAVSPLALAVQATASASDAAGNVSPSSAFTAPVSPAPAALAPSELLVGLESPDSGGQPAALMVAMAAPSPATVVAGPLFALAPLDTTPDHYA